MYLKTDVFKTEISWIKDEELRKFATEIVKRLPDYFFEVAASSTGKYHSESCLGAGGLVRHTKAALMIANDLFRLESIYDFSDEEKDCIIISLMFHDGWKHGNTMQRYTTFEHPAIAKENIDRIWNEFKHTDGAPHITDFQCSLICGCIESHMGIWNTSNRSKTVLPIPATKPEEFVHLCDYLASRSYLVYKFDVNYVPDKYKVDESVIELQKSKETFIARCKELIDSGIERESIYEQIKIANNGIRNPLKIESMEVLRDAEARVEALVTG